MENWLTQVRLEKWPSGLNSGSGSSGFVRNLIVCVDMKFNVNDFTCIQLKVNLL